MFSPEKRSRIMSKVKNKNTDIEMKLRRELWHRGYRYRVTNGKIPGRPDIAFLSRKVAVFCDGDFWHGRKYEKEKSAYSSFWRNKIKKNMARDKEVTRELNRLGWTVLRFWKKELLGIPDKCADKVVSALGVA